MEVGPCLMLLKKGVLEMLFTHLIIAVILQMLKY